MRHPKENRSNCLGHWETSRRSEIEVQPLSATELNHLGRILQGQFGRVQEPSVVLAVGRSLQLDVDRFGTLRCTEADGRGVGSVGLWEAGEGAVRRIVINMGVSI